MKINKEITVNIIQQDAYDTGIYSIYASPSICFKVIFSTKYILTICGTKHIIKTKEKIVPFTFPSFDAAKDFCTVNPKIKKVVFTNNEDSLGVTYETYCLKKNKKVIGYIKWDSNYVETINNNTVGMYFKPTKYDPIIVGFVKDVQLQSWVKTHDYSNIIFGVFSQLLSTLNKKRQHNIYNQWTFKLVDADEEK